MAEKKTGMCRDFIIHPGEHLLDVLEERNISEVDLAERINKKPKYVHQVVTGAKDISKSLAKELSNALQIPSYVWLNLQKRFDEDMADAARADSITSKERSLLRLLKEVVATLRKLAVMPELEPRDNAIIHLREVLQIPNLECLNQYAPSGAFRKSSGRVDPCILGAWVRLCEISPDTTKVSGEFDHTQIRNLITELKKVMRTETETAFSHVVALMADCLGKHGIKLISQSWYTGAPIQGYIIQSGPAEYRVFLTSRQLQADIIWFSLFHELGHIANGDLQLKDKYLDGENTEFEKHADQFAEDALLDAAEYTRYVNDNDMSSKAIIEFAKSQEVPPYVVVGRLQKEKRIPPSWYPWLKKQYTPD